MRCSVIALSIIFFSSLVWSANFYLCNEHFHGSVTFISGFEKPINLNNFRIRMVANELFLKSEEFVAEYITANQSEMDKAYIPSLMTESGNVKVFGHKSPSTLFTLLITADLSQHDRESTKYVKPIHYVTDHAIAPHDLIKIMVRTIIPSDKDVDMDFCALVDKDDGRGFTPITFKKI